MTENQKTVPGVVRQPDSGESAPEDNTDSLEDVFSRTTVIAADEAGIHDPDERLQPGSILRDRFLLQKRVAGGSMGVVYQALDRRLAEVDGVEPYVAIKVLSPQLARSGPALRALQQEAAKGRCLTHRNIVRFIDLDRDDDLYFIVMEWLPGQSLANALDEGALQPDTQRVIEIVRQIAEALDYAHRCGVVHADVKPGNIMLLPDGNVKLFDFGIARVRQQQEGPAGIETAVLRAATPAYSSMQVLTGEEPVPADDVFSLACLAYRLLAGHRVFGPRNAAEAAESGMEPQRPQGLTDEQWKVLRKGLTYARVTRYATPREFSDALQRAPRLRDVQPALTVPDDVVAQRHAATRRARWPQRVVLLLLLGAAGATLLRPEWRLAARAALQPVIASAMRVIARSGPPPAASPVVAAAGEPAGTGTPDVNGDGQAAASAREPAAAENGPAEAAANEASAGPDAGGQTPAVAQAAAEEAVESGEEPADATGREAFDTAAAPGPPASSEPAVDLQAASGPFSLVLGAPGTVPPVLELTLAEEDGPSVIELYRGFALAEPLLVRIDEIGFSGNRSPGEAGHYALSDGGVVSFDPGQRSARFSIIPTSDDDREPDRQVSLLLRDYYSAESRLGEVNVRLLDDDQRLFEADLQQNSVAFATAGVTVSERDPAALVDLVRFNPDQNTLSVRFFVDGGTATENEDFFIPGQRVATFGPGQRNARLLIPLVQDTVVEGSESFDIVIDSPAAADNTNGRVTVTIRDDDFAAE